MFRHSRSLTSVRGLGLVLIVLASGCQANPEVAKQEYLKSGDRYVAEKKYGEAIVQYRNALQQDPKFGEARYKLAEVYLKVGDARGATREYIRAADLLPDNVDLQVKVAALLLLSKQFEDAKTRAETALDKAPKNIEAQIIRANALAGLNEYDSAIKQLEEANKLQPTVGAYGTIGAIESERGSKPDAEKAFRAAVAVDPKSVNAHLALANYLMSAGRAADAEASLKRALAIEPGNVLANRGVAAFYIASGRVADAEPSLKMLAQQDKSARATYKIALAEYFAQTGRLADAQKILAPLTGNKESSAAAQTRLAAIQYMQKETAQAHKAVDVVLQREPKNEEALVLKTRFLLTERKLDEALKTAQATVAANPQSATGFYLLGNIQRLRLQPAEAMAAFTEVLKLNPRAVTAQLQLSELNLAAGKGEAGLQFAEDAARAVPASPYIQLNLARNLVARGELARADRIVQSLVTRYPGEPAVHAIAGTLSLGKKDLPSARNNYERTLSLDPLNLEALTGLATIDFAEKKGAAARARVEAALTRAPTNSYLLALAARTYVGLGDVTAAEGALKKAISADSAAIEAYSLLGQLYLSQHKLDQARAEFDLVAQRDPKNLAARTMSATISEMQGNHADARRRYEQILELDSRAPVAANNLAYSMAEAGENLDVALQLAQTAKSGLPNVPEVNDTLGFVYLKKDLASLAIPPLNASVDADPKNPVYLYHLGLAYARSGEPAKARTTLNRALALSSTFPGAEDARQVLGRL